MTSRYRLASLIVLAWVAFSWASNCVDNRDYFQNLPPEIGKEDQFGKYLYALNCDTVYVRKGVTTVINPGTMVYFAKPSLNCVIKVEGTLIVKGTKNSYVSFSGSLDSTRTGPEAGKKQWGGIEIEDGGSVNIEFAGFMRAPTPITSFSKQVKIVNTWFKGSTGIVLPDGSLYPMEKSWHAINSLDLTQGNSDRNATQAEKPANTISQSEKSALLEKNENGFWTWKKIAGGAAVLVAVGVGAELAMAPGKSTPKTSPETTDKKSPIGDPPSLTGLP